MARDRVVDHPATIRDVRRPLIRKLLKPVRFIPLQPGTDRSR